MRFLSSPFSIWVLPLRLMGAAAAIAGVALMLMSANPTTIAIAVAGSLIWQVGTLVEERSSLFQRLETTPVSGLMRARLVPVASWWTLEKMRSQFRTVDDQSFFVTTENGYLTGVALPKWIWEASADDARYRRMEEVARPIEYVDAVRQDDSVLAAFSRMKLLRRHHLSVTDARDTLVGVITLDQVTSFMGGSFAPQEVSTARLQLKPSVAGVNNKMAA